MAHYVLINSGLCPLINTDQELKGDWARVRVALIIDRDAPTGA